MSIEKISDSEISQASIQNLATRPNEVTRFGQQALTADELKAAFDAMGLLNARKYNALIDSLTAGEFSERIQLPSGETLSSHLDGIDTEIAEAKGFFAPMTPIPFTYPTALSYDHYGIRASLENGKPVIKAGSNVNRGGSASIKFASFPITAGVTYHVGLLEEIWAYYNANTGHITDGGRLRIIEDIDSNGSEDYVHKLTNFGNEVRELQSTREFVTFTASGNGTANITLSIYNNGDRLVMPWQTEDVTLTPAVYQSGPVNIREDGRAYVLALDDSFRPKWHLFNTVGTGSLTATYTKAEINQKIETLTRAIIALGGNV